MAIWILCERLAGEGFPVAPTRWRWVGAHTAMRRLTGITAPPQPGQVVLDRIVAAITGTVAP